MFQCFLHFHGFPVFLNHLGPSCLNQSSQPRAHKDFAKCSGTGLIKKKVQQKVLRKINGILKWSRVSKELLLPVAWTPSAQGVFRVQGPKGPHMWSHRVSCSSTCGHLAVALCLFVLKGCWEHVAYHPAISFQQVNNFATYRVVIILLISKTQEFQIYFSDIFTIFHPKNLEKKTATER